MVEKDDGAEGIIVQRLRSKFRSNRVDEIAGV
jgi:hypothetical protein